MAFDDTGATVHDRTLDASGFHMVTGVREHDGWVWLGSLEEPAVAVLRPVAPRVAPGQSLRVNSGLPHSASKCSA